MVLEGEGKEDGMSGSLTSGITVGTAPKGKTNAFPLLKDWLAEHNSVKGYLLLYHEAVICNLLEAVLYHKEACEAAGECSCSRSR